MKEFVLHVPEDRSQFMMELLSQLGFQRMEEDADLPTAKIQEFVMNRREKMKSEELIDWEDAAGTFVFQA